jgi:hypothetical protein
MIRNGKIISDMIYKSYSGGSTATGRGTHAGQVKGDDPDENGYPDPPGWGLDRQPQPATFGFVSKPQLKPQKRKKAGETMARKRAKAP